MNKILKQLVFIISLSTCVVSLVWLIYNYYTKNDLFSPLVALLGGIPVSILSYDSIKASENPANYRNIMLNQVKNIWIKGFLEKSLLNESLIELGLEERSSEIKSPLNKIIQTLGKPNRKLPQGTKIIDIFDENKRSLLILGEPGSGKTTMLLELARDTIARAEKDSNEPIPVVFNLSSWNKQPISEWLIAELITIYSVPEKNARYLIENNVLLFLLDGLDEVSPNLREDCVKKINDFQKEHLVSIVVCSRLADYEDLTNRLDVQNAVLLQPPTEEQIYDYISIFDREVDALRTLIRTDQTFRELSLSPLMINIMILAYKGKPVEDVQSSGTIKENKKQLFDSYVENMFNRRSEEQPYTKEKTKYWLSWIAHNLSSHSQSIFLVDRLQMNSLNYDLPFTIALVICIISGLIGLYVGGPLFSLPLCLIGIFKGYSNDIELIERVNFKFGDNFENIQYVFYSASVSGCISAMIFWSVRVFAVGVVSSIISGNLQPILPYWESTRDYFVISLITGIPLIIILFFHKDGLEIKCHLLESLKNNFEYVLLWTLLLASFFWFFVEFSFIYDELAPWFMPFCHSKILNLLIILLLRFIFPAFVLIVYVVIFMALAYTQYHTQDYISHMSPKLLIIFLPIFFIFRTNLINYIWIFLLIFLSNWAVDMKYGIFFKKFKDEKTIPKIPNEGLRQSLKSAIFSSIIFGAIGGLVSGLFCWQVMGIKDVFIYFLMGLVIFGLIFGLEYGGRSCIQHAVLRIILWYKGLLPLNCSLFLNYAVERIFLRKVGGGYIFIHRELMDYFASLEDLG